MRRHPSLRCGHQSAVFQAADVLHFLQIRSPAHSLTNSDLHIMQFRVLRSGLSEGSVFFLVLRIVLGDRSFGLIALLVI